MEPYIGLLVLGKRQIITGILALLLTVSSISISPVSAQDDTVDRDILFGRKTFVDNPETMDGFLSISGTIIGDGIAYKNNTVNISCYRDRMECWASKIEQIGLNQLGDLRSPNVLVVKIWTAGEVIADNGIDCPRITVVIDRRAQTGMWVQGVINADRTPENNPCAYPDRQTYDWTIEDPS
jgi:hypothetical protein